MWRSAMQAALEAVRRFGSERVRLQPYETLVAGSGRRDCASSAAWLGVDYEDAMLGVTCRA